MPEVNKMVKRAKKYTLVIDCGIPYDFENISETKVMRELKKLEKKSDDSPYCDINIYHGKKDVTNGMFKKFRKMKKDGRKKW